MVIDYLKIYTFLSKEEIEELEKSNTEHPELREAHKALAREIITFLHGKEEYERAINLADSLFKAVKIMEKLSGKNGFKSDNSIYNEIEKIYKEGVPKEDI